ncbi:dickkopf-related protein 4 isoform X2 [Hemicordylus capensis]|uniref:dickkopf-related protein 4 isoform X2 n=1 Tax=Hemicordylus capensis TaxID=884348 RepID=UPI0023028E88|nr:dickkopf-related protein 4 isoform X2 [Hemicordylus capensis]
MAARILLGLACLCSPLAALVLDFNTIRSSTEISSSKKSAQCLTDKDCPAGRFCHKPWEELPFCATCHGLRRRCQRTTMCCPGTLCVNEICSLVEKTALVEEKKRVEQTGSDSRDVPQSPAEAGHVVKKGSAQRPPRNDGAQEGEKCLRTSECAPGLCCARHFWAKICKPVLTEGQVCSKRGQKEGAQGPEIFQRCDCGLGLWCQVSSGTSQHSRLWVCQRN